MLFRSIRGNFKGLYIITAAMIAACLCFAATLAYEKKMRKKPRLSPAAGQAPEAPPDQDSQHGLWKVLDKQALPASLNYLLICLAVGGMITFLPLYARNKGFTYISLFFLMQAAAMFVTRLVTGRIFDRKGPIPVIIPALSFAAASFILILLTNSEVVFLFAGFLYGMALGMLQPVYNALAVRRASVNRRGAASATFNLSIDIGIGLGAAAWGVIIDRTGFSLMFIGSSICMLLAMMVSLIL